MCVRVASSSYLDTRLDKATERLSLLEPCPVLPLEVDGAVLAGAVMAKSGLVDLDDDALVGGEATTFVPDDEVSTHATSVRDDAAANMLQS